MKFNKIISVVGARPNFMKVAPVHRAMESVAAGVHRICHTGQHYDERMSRVFFEELEMPRPEWYLGVGSGSHAVQTAKIMVEFEKVVMAEKPDLVLVAGDVNSTVACALVAVKLGVKVGHIEAGLRSFDRTMPEEINRILTDSISDFLFVTEKSGMENLLREGISRDKIFFVGNCMIDSVVRYLPKARSLSVRERFGAEKGKYILVTLHRPKNVDDDERIKEFMEYLELLSQKRKVIFPVHPRTRKQIEKNLHIGKSSMSQINEHGLILTEPMGYLEFLNLMEGAELVLTDSGGIQEETTYLGVQCVTLRENTERPITVELGTNHLVGENLVNAGKVIEEILSGKKKEGRVPEMWDGKAAMRIVRAIMRGDEVTE